MLAFSEMFLWNSPRVQALFGTDKLPANIRNSMLIRNLSANQGIYNYFLSLGCFYSLYHKTMGNDLGIFFTGCVVMAAVFGTASTGNKRIVIAQGGPAMIALFLHLVLSYF